MTSLVAATPVTLQPPADRPKAIPASLGGDGPRSQMALPLPFDRSLSSGFLLLVTFGLLAASVWLLGSLPLQPRPCSKFPLL